MKSKAETVSRPTRRDWSLAGGHKFDREQIIAMVCSHFCKGLRVGEIHTELKKHGINLTREQPYEILRWAAQDGRLSYHPPLDAGAAHQLLERYSWLQRARVINSPEGRDAAAQAAKLLVELMRGANREELHVGFAGGPLMAEMARATAELLARHERFLRRLVLHALVAAGFNLPLGPNNFLQCFVDANLECDVEIVPLPVPGFVSQQTLDSLRKEKDFEQYFAATEQIQFFVSSAGAHWDRGCSGLNELYRRGAPRVVQMLDELGCVGDLIWQPIGANGVIEMTEVGLGPAALLNLEQLAESVKRGARSILVVSPCGSCGQSKSEVLQSILEAPEHLITDVVADSRAVNRLLKKAAA